MLEQRWSYDAAKSVVREAPRFHTAIDLIEPDEMARPDDTVRLDIGGYRSSFTSRRRPTGSHGAGDAEFGVRDAFAATALAAQQSTGGDASVLDVDGVELTRSVAVLPRPPVAEEAWTPPTLTTPPPAPAPVIDEFPTESEPLPEIGRRQRPQPRRSLTPILTGVGVLGVLVLLVGGLYYTMIEGGSAPVARSVDASEETDPSEATAAAEGEVAADAGAAAAPAPAGTEQLANVEGVLQLTDATLREDNGGQPGEPATTFTAGQKVSLWLAFDYTSREATDNLGVVWLKEDQELTRSSFGLTSEVQMTAMAAPALEEPGTYHAEISLNDQIIHTVSFDVTD